MINQYYLHGDAQYVSYIRPPTRFTFNGDQGQVLVTIHGNGDVEIPEGVDVTEAARVFWNAVVHLSGGALKIGNENDTGLQN